MYHSLDALSSERHVEFMECYSMKTTISPGGKLEMGQYLYSYSIQLCSYITKCIAIAISHV